MPPPPPSFTKAKWLTFFAQVTSKITHHNVSVVIEGCEVLKRLLISRVSIGAFLEEADLIQHVFNTTMSVVRCDKAPTNQDCEMLHALMQCLSLMVDMMVSMYADGDSYYQLLVVSRSAIFIDGFTMLLQGKNQSYYGFTCKLLKTLLSMPLTKRREPIVLEEGVHAIRHVKSLEDALHRIPLLIQQLSDTVMTLSIAASGAMLLCNRYVTDLCQFILTNINDDDVMNSSDPSIRSASVSHANNANETGIAATMLSSPQKNSNTKTGNETTSAQQQQTSNTTNINAGNSRPGLNSSAALLLLPISFEAQKEVSDATVAAYQKAGTNARSHHDVFEGINDLWCCWVVNAEAVCTASLAVHTKSLERYLRNPPKTSLDDVLFRQLLAWFSALLTSGPAPSDMRDAMLVLVSQSLLPTLTIANNKKGGATTANSSSRPGSSTTSMMNNSSSSNALEKPSVVFSVLSFMTAVEPICPRGIMEGWIGNGLLGYLEHFIREAQGITSVLIDAPSTVDGTLPDEVYLDCALKTCQNEKAVLCGMVMKLLSDILVRFQRLFSEKFLSESVSLVQLMVPQCMKVLIHNPTMQQGSSTTTSAASLIHHYPRCHRACRATPLGECAAVLLDTLVSISGSSVSALSEDMTRDIVTSLPAISRATRNSIQPHLRALSYRLLVRVCKTCIHIVSVVREMPSAIPTALSTVLTYQDGSPMWEAAGAAEFLRHFLTLTADDPTLDESINVGQSMLPVQLVKLASSFSICYATSTFMALVHDVVEQQERLRKKGLQMQCVLAPHGTQSLHLWTNLLQLFTSANFTLYKVVKKLNSRATTTNSSTNSSSASSGIVKAPPMMTKDAMARAASAFEEISIQFSFTAHVLRALKRLLTLYPEYRDLLDANLINTALTSVLHLQPPPQLAHAVGKKFATDLPHSALLQRSYEEMTNWACEFAATWFHASSTVKFPGLPEEFCEGMSTVIGCEGGISIVARTSAAFALNVILSLTFQTDLISSIRPSSRTLFEALLTLPHQDSPVIAAAQCRLVSLFEYANLTACSCGWLSGCIQHLHELSCALRVSNGTFTAIEMEDFAVTLSQVLTTVSSDYCRMMSEADGLKLGASLCTFLHFEKVTRMTTLKALEHLAMSEVGRRVLLLESAEMGSVTHRSVFSRVIQIVGFHSVHNNAFLSEAASPSSVSTHKTKRQQTQSQLRQPALMQMWNSEANLGLEVICVAVAQGRENFVAALIKLKVLDLIEEYIIAFDQATRHQAGPTVLFRFLSSATLCGEVQGIVARKPNLLTILIDHATDNKTVIGTLCMLTLRNICFHTAVKMQICQDTRILNVFKSALNSGTSSSSASNQLGTEAMTETYRQHQLATSALWALAYNNQRGKTYVRGLLNGASGGGGSSSIGSPSSPSSATLDSQNMKSPLSGGGGGRGVTRTNGGSGGGATRKSSPPPLSAWSPSMKNYHKRQNQLNETDESTTERTVTYSNLQDVFEAVMERNMEGLAALGLVGE